MDTYWVDTDHDGYADFGATDTNGDGYYDTYLVDSDGDHLVDMTGYDTNEDGTVDAIAVDADENGTADSVHDLTSEATAAAWEAPMTGGGPYAGHADSDWLLTSNAAVQGTGGVHYYYSDSAY